MVEKTPLLFFLGLLFLLLALSAPVNAAWTVSYNSPEQGIRSLAIYNGKLYAGTESYGSIYVYDGNSWNLSYASHWFKFGLYLKHASPERAFSV